MEKIFPLLSASPLFEGIGREDFSSVLRCLGARTNSFEKGEALFFEGDVVTELGLLVSGRLHLLRSDIRGNTSLVMEIVPPELFAEAVVCGGLGRMPVSVVAREASEVLTLDYKKVVTTCTAACDFHAKLIRNMIGVLARKNIMMSAKIEHMSKRTTREKLLSYLNDVARQKGKRAFAIPFTRQELADYLCVERSALSAEMSKLKASGVLDYRKNNFELLLDEER